MAATAQRVAVYCRISDPKKAVGESFPVQERDCRIYADAHGLEVVRVVHEQADSYEIDRPKLRDLLAAGKRGEFDAVMVWKQDRLGRGNMAHEVLYYLILNAGLQPLCALEPYG